MLSSDAGGLKFSSNRYLPMYSASRFGHAVQRDLEQACSVPN